MFKSSIGKKASMIQFGQKKSGYFPIFFLMEFKETKSATMNIFEKISFLFKSFVTAELSEVFTINLFTIAENCMEK